LDNHKYDHEGTIQTRKYTQVWMQDIRDWRDSSIRISFC
jgi:hypothetical protein